MFLYLLYQINRHQHTKSWKRWSYSGPYCDGNMKSITETYASYLIFMRLPGITWNDQEFKVFLKKMIRIIY